MDKIHLLVTAGRGGNGCESFFRRRDKKTVPHGGDGGHGGSIIFRADTNAPPIENFRYKQHLVAESGGHGGSSRKRGKNGKNLTALVPPGTRILDRAQGLVVRDLAQAGDEVVVARGGRGGAGNAGGKSASRGEKGEGLEIELEFQIAADIFLVGLPNSGKSRLLNFFTRARTREEAYPFATTVPALGVHPFSEYEQITLCELPSVYRMSHEGRGRGMHFLRHLDRAKLLIYVLDPFSEFSDSLAEGLKILHGQVKKFRKEFSELPSAVVVNKMDLPQAREKVKKKKFKPGVPVFYLSAATGEGTEKLLEYLKDQLCAKS